MILELHEKAITAFNERASHLLTSVDRCPRKREEGNAKEDTTSSETAPYVSATLNQTDIIGDIFGKQETRDGKFHKATLITDSEVIELNKEGCGNLMALSESIWRAGKTASLIDQNFIDREFFHWVASPFSGSVDFINFLSNAVEGAVKNCTILIPLHRVRSSIRFRMLGHLIRQIHGNDLESWFPAENHKESLIEMRRSLQGYCCVQIELLAEPDYATNEALRIADIIASILAMHSMAGIFINARYNGVPLGKEHAPQYTALIFTPDGPLPTVKQGLVSTDDMQPFDLDMNRLKAMGKLGLFDMANLFDEQKKSDLEMKLRDSISTFCRASFTRSTSEKLVFAVVAMETLFIANESEPIGQNLADRLAMHVGSSLEERKRYAANVKKAYGLRSRYVHHGKSTEDSEVISDFIMLAYRALTHTVVAARTYSTKAEFLSSLDDMKYTV